MTLMKFFTDKTVKNDYLLIKIKDFLKMRENNPPKLEQYKEVLVDPGVYDLQKSDKYSWEDEINIGNFLDSLKSNEYFSCDYPPDMNEKYTKIFIKKTWENIDKYGSHSQYITAVQSKFESFESLKENFDKVISLNTRFIAVGNLCRINHLTHFLQKSIIYIIRNLGDKRIHFYGL